ncbi:MAG: DUF5786 family protein [Halobacteriaceae archaeon]
MNCIAHPYRIYPIPTETGLFFYSQHKATYMGFGSYDESEQQNQEMEDTDDSEGVSVKEAEYEGEVEVESDADTDELVAQLQNMKEATEE